MRRQRTRGLSNKECSHCAGGGGCRCRCRQLCCPSWMEWHKACNACQLTVLQASPRLADACRAPGCNAYKGGTHASVTVTHREAPEAVKLSCGCLSCSYTDSTCVGLGPRAETIGSDHVLPCLASPHLTSPHLEVDLCAAAAASAHPLHALHGNRAPARRQPERERGGKHVRLTHDHVRRPASPNSWSGDARASPTLLSKEDVQPETAPIQSAPCPCPLALSLSLAPGYSLLQYNN